MEHAEFRRVGSPS